MTLYVINPNSSQHVTDGLAAACSPLSRLGYPIEFLSLAEGPPGIETQAHIDSVVAPLHALAMSKRDASGFVVACFSDPGVAALRAKTTLPVLGIREAALTSSLTLGRSFGIIAIRPASIPRHLAAIAEMGLSERLAGDRAIDLGVTELADESRTEGRLMTVAQQLRDEDGADVLILGCAGMAHYRARIEAALGVPTVDPTQAAVALALGRNTLGQTHSPKVKHAH